MTGSDRADVISAGEAKALLSDLGDRIGIPGLGFDADGQVALRLNGDTVVTLTLMAERGCVLVSTPLAAAGQVPTALLRELLRGNLRWQQNGDGIFAIPPGADEVSFSRLVSLHHRSAVQLERDLAEYASAVVRIAPAFGLGEQVDGDTPADPHRIFG